jgi:hypothetical protein
VYCNNHSHRGAAIIILSHLSVSVSAQLALSRPIERPAVLLDACGKGLKAVKVERAFPITSAIAHLMCRISNQIQVRPWPVKSLYAQVIPSQGCFILMLPCLP